MFLSKSLCMSIAERKKSEHLLRGNERYTQPGAQMGKTFESDPFRLYRGVWNEETGPASENVQ